MDEQLWPVASTSGTKSPTRILSEIGIRRNQDDTSSRNFISDDEPFIQTEETMLPPENDTDNDIKDKDKKSFFKKCCSVQTLKRKLPIISWLPQYNLRFLSGDFVAGVTVALTVIPQAIAYAAIAEVPPQYGLYSAFMGCFVYIFFGGIKELSIGPTAILCLLTAEYSLMGGPHLVILLCFLGGCVQVLLGLLNLGFIVDFISTPIISAFTSAAAIIIAMSQVKGLLGLKFHSHDFVHIVYNIFKNISKTNFWDLGMGIIVIITLLLLRALRNSKWPKNSTFIPDKIRKPLKIAVWIFTTSRNAVIILICTGVAIAFLNHDIGNLTLTGNVKTGLPDVSLPQFSFSAFIKEKNSTIHFTFMEAIKEIGPGLIIIPLISTLESIAIAKVFSGGKRLDATQEMITLGLANVASSFFSSLPITGSFSRSAINATSGVKSTFAGFFTGVIVLLALGFLGPTFKYIPKAALSGMIFCAVIFMVHYEVVTTLWKIKKSDLLLYLITFLTCLGLGLEIGILCGSGASILSLLFFHARPSITYKRFTIAGHLCIRVRPDRGIFYPASEYVRSSTKKRCSDQEVIVFDAGYIYNSDYTSMKVFKLMVEDFVKSEKIVIILNPKKEFLNLFDLMEINGVKVSNDGGNLEMIINECLAERVAEKEAASKQAAALEELSNEPGKNNIVVVNVNKL